MHRLGEELSQVEFAKHLGISKQRLCDIERDRFTVSIRLAKEIAKKLDLPAEWLVKLAVAQTDAHVKKLICGGVPSILWIGWWESRHH